MGVNLLGFLVNHTYTSNTNLVDKTTIEGAGGITKLLRPNRRVSLIVCSVKQGAIDVYFGSSPEINSVPDLHFGQTNRPVPVPIPCGQYEFSIVCADPLNNTQASVILGGPGE
jgi:hypothetical protein